MKTKHTPGPWAFREGSEPHYQALVYNEENGEDVAITYHDDGATNAKLIAAAPELLEAAEWALTELREPEHSTADTIHETIQKLQQAIKKATE